MEIAIAKQIIDCLAQGIHPVTGEAMPEDSPYNAPPVIRDKESLQQYAAYAQMARAGGRTVPDFPPNTQILSYGEHHG